jgi:hypothetical protein
MQHLGRRRLQHENMFLQLLVASLQHGKRPPWEHRSIPFRSPERGSIPAKSMTIHD